MLEHITDFTAWPILTGILVGYLTRSIFDRFACKELCILCCWCYNCVVALEETTIIEYGQ